MDISNHFLLKTILKACKEDGVTSYDIGQNTSISNQAAYKILKGITQNPRRKNLLEILNYLEENRIRNKQRPLIVSEPPVEYETVDESNLSCEEKLIRRDNSIASLNIAIEQLNNKIVTLKQFIKDSM